MVGWIQHGPVTRIATVAILSATCAIGATPAAAQQAGGDPLDGSELRVRLLEGVRSARVSGSGLRLDGVGPVPSEITVESEAGALRIGRRAPLTRIGLSADADLRLDGRPMAGRLDLVARGRGRFDVIAVLPLEDYVARAVAGEVYANWPWAALAAQAVAARTYALRRRASSDTRDFDVEAHVLSQKYSGKAPPESVFSAAKGTAGEILWHGGRPALAVFHSSAGGRTASAEEVWGSAVPYLRSVASPDDEGPDFFWSYDIAAADLVHALEAAGHDPGPLDAVHVEQRTPSGRVARLALGRARLSGRDLRQVLGGRAIRSALFDVRREADRLRFVGSGAGHGVGLCQWGARELARQGRSYREILAHYYPGTELRRIDASGWSAQH